MWTRVGILLRPRLVALWRGTFVESAPLWMHAVVATVVCLIVRGEVTPHGYRLVTLTMSAALLAIPVLGEFGAHLRTDPAREWVEALPVRAVELTLARTAVVLVAVSTLAAAALLPAALLAPGFSIVERSLLVVAGLGQAVVLIAALFGVQAVLRGPLEGLLVALQTLLVAGVIVGSLVGLRMVPRLAELEAGPGWIELFPPAWFAALDGRALAALAAASVVLFVARSETAVRPTTGRGVLDRLLVPLRWLATRLWVRRDERTSFDLVYDALPREREFVLRTYPMLGIPLAFLVLGARGESGDALEGLLAVLLFTPAVYMPILLTHVPATRTPEAGWLLQTAPLSPGAIANGALKAVAVRFVFPLFLLLAALAAALAGPEFAVTLALPGALASLITMRFQYRSCVSSTPLSRGLDELETERDLLASMLGQSIVLPVMSLFVLKLVVTPLHLLVLVAVLVAVEVAFDRSWSRSFSNLREGSA